MDHERIEQLIGRVVDGTAGPADWNELELLAHSPTGEGALAVWEQLADALRAEALLQQAGHALAQRVETVSLPPAPVATRSWSGASGWAAAAAVIVLWCITSFTTPSLEAPVPAEPLTAEAALDRYLEIGREEGQVLGTLPDEVLEAHPSEDGETLEVVYLRRWVEKTTVKQVLEVSEDESGSPAPNPVAWKQFVSSGPH